MSTKELGINMVSGTDQPQFARWVPSQEQQLILAILSLPRIEIGKVAAAHEMYWSVRYFLHARILVF